MTDPRLSKLLEQAEEHGKQDDPDHEVGDLQGFLFSCWALMTPEAQQKVLDEHLEED